MYRVYDLKDGYFVQDTAIEDEFGESWIRIVGELSAGREGDVLQRISLSCSGSIPVSLRISEMQHFLGVFALFDPHFNTKQDGFSQIVSQTPPEPWEKE